MSKKKIYTPRKAHVVCGGIRAQQVRGSQGKAWWCRKWIDSIEHLSMGARLGRGRQYAIAGQVTDIDIQPYTIKAVVQGAEDKPYACEIGIEELTPKMKKALLAEFHSNPMYAARLLVQELPPEVDELFVKHAKHSLFSDETHAFRTKCSCKDWANPCKHIAAVYFLFGETITQDPLQLLYFAGINAEEICGEEITPEKRKVKTVKHSPTDFWGPSHHEPFYGFGDVTDKGVIAPLLMRLSAPPLWRGYEKFGDIMNTAYTRAATKGRQIVDGGMVDYRRLDERVHITNSDLKIHSKHLRVDY